MRIRMSRVQDGQCSRSVLSSNIRIASSRARIKPTAPLLVFDKKNSIEFLLDFSILLIQLLYSLCTSFPHLSCDPSVRLLNSKPE